MRLIDREHYLTGVHVADDGTAVDFDGRFTVASMPGTAFYLLGWASEETPESWELECAGDGAHTDPEADEDEPAVDLDDNGHGPGCYLYSEPEQVDRTDQVIAVMVGDDGQHVVDVADLTPIGLAEDGTPDYCGGCGSTTCQADGRNA